MVVGSPAALALFDRSNRASRCIVEVSCSGGGSRAATELEVGGCIASWDSVTNRRTHKPAAAWQPRAGFEPFHPSIIQSPSRLPRRRIS